MNNENTEDVIEGGNEDSENCRKTNLFGVRNRAEISVFHIKLHLTSEKT